MNMSTPLALALALASSTTQAQAPEGRVTKIEAASGPLIVTWGQPELAKANEYHVRIADFDRNGDGKLSRDEIPAGHALQFEFKVVDTNHNGTLSEQELASWR